jgi:hypothetical protein
MAAKNENRVANSHATYRQIKDTMGSVTSMRSGLRRAMVANSRIFEESGMVGGGS